MWMLGPLGFISPWLLLGLMGLPVLWLLLRAVPPAPIISVTCCCRLSAADPPSGSRYTPSRNTPQPILFSERQMRMRAVALEVGRLMIRVSHGVEFVM